LKRFFNGWSIGGGNAGFYDCLMWCLSTIILALMEIMEVIFYWVYGDKGLDWKVYALNIFFEKCMENFKFDGGTWFS